MSMAGCAGLNPSLLEPRRTVQASQIQASGIESYDPWVVQHGQKLNFLIQARDGRVTFFKLHLVHGLHHLGLELTAEIQFMRSNVPPPVGCPPARRRWPSG